MQANNLPNNINENNDAIDDRVMLDGAILGVAAATAYSAYTGALRSFMTAQQAETGSLSPATQSLFPILLAGAVIGGSVGLLGYKLYSFFSGNRNAHNINQAQPAIQRPVQVAPPVQQQNRQHQL